MCRSYIAVQCSAVQGGVKLEYKFPPICHSISDPLKSHAVQFQNPNSPCSKYSHPPVVLVYVFARQAILPPFPLESFFAWPSVWFCVWPIPWKSLSLLFLAAPRSIVVDCVPGCWVWWPDWHRRAKTLHTAWSVSWRLGCWARIGCDEEVEALRTWKSRPRRELQSPNPGQSEDLMKLRD